MSRRVGRSLEARVLHWFQGQMGTGILEEKNLSELARGINGRVLQAMAMYLPVTPAMRVSMQRARGVKIGKNVFIGIEVYIDPAYPHLVEIEDFVSLAGRNIIFTHSVATMPMREKKLVPPRIARVRIKRGAWLAVGSIVLPGVTVGENSLVAAGAVVTKDIPPYCLAAGVPARVVRRLEPYEG